MAPFDELQRLWQRQPERTVPAGEAAAATQAFRRYGLRQDALYLGKAMVVASQLVVLVMLLRHEPLGLFGGCLADFSAILFLISDWRRQRAIAGLNFAAPSVEFLRSAIAKLEGQRNPFGTREFYIAMAGFWVGCTLMIASRRPVWEVWRDLPAFAAISAVPFVVYALGRRIRARRFEKQCRPLIERLEGMLRKMEEDRA